MKKGGVLLPLVKMTYLVYYQEEKVEFKEAFEKKFNSTEEAEIVLKKLIRHYKLREPSISWTSGRNHAHAGRWNITLHRDHNNFGFLCHELGHTFTGQKFNDVGHNKKHKKAMKRFIAYCSKKEWFTTELSRRLAPKAPKSEPTKLEVKAKELIKQQEKIIRYEKKVLFYSRKLSKAKKSYSLRMKNIEKLREDKEEKMNNEYFKQEIEVKQ